MKALSLLCPGADSKCNFLVFCVHQLAVEVASFFIVSGYGR